MSNFPIPGSGLFINTGGSSYVIPWGSLFEPPVVGTPVTANARVNGKSSIEASAILNIPNSMRAEGKSRGVFSAQVTINAAFRLSSAMSAGAGYQSGSMMKNIVVCVIT